MKNNLNISRIKEIIKRRLIKIPSEVRKFFPKILSQPKISIKIIKSKNYILIVFLRPEEKARRENDLIRKKLSSFPGLIAKDDKSKVAFRIESRNTLITSCTIKNMFSLSLGKDSTAILCDHKQILDTEDFGKYEYTVELAYVISFGDEINQANVYDYFEELVAYSIKRWREANG